MKTHKHTQRERSRYDVAESLFDIKCYAQNAVHLLKHIASTKQNIAFSNTKYAIKIFTGMINDEMGYHLKYIH